MLAISNDRPMKYIAKTLVLLIVAISLFSCNHQPSPDKVVAQTWLNVNNITSHYSSNFFRILQEMKSKDNITVVRNNEVIKGTSVEYVKQYVIAPVIAAQKKVEKLPEKEDIKEIITASLEVYKYGRAVFEKEYLAIALMIDEEKPEAEINTAIENIYIAHDPVMQEKLNKLDELVFPYAKKHKIPIKTYGEELQ